jgi:S-adenosylmethionine-dependent methyltransferase
MAGVTQLSTGRFEETDRYTAYLRTTEGLLRVDLGWMNLRGFLPANVEAQRALDVGGGTGPLTLRLAALGFEVELLDSSEPMLALARKEAKAKALNGRISFRQADVNCLADLFEPSSFDLVVCHNLLEYMEDPPAILRALAQVLKKGTRSVVSLLVRNRYGEALKTAIKRRDLEQARAALRAETVVDCLYGQPVRVFDPDEVRRMVEQSGLKLLALRGVRVVADYLDCGALTEDAYKRLLDLELLLGAQPQLAAIARYTQIIACPSSKTVGRRGK